MNLNRKDGYFCSRTSIHKNFDGSVYTEDGGYTDEYVEWLEDTIVSNTDSMLYNISDFKGRADRYFELSKDDTFTEEEHKEYELKFRNMNSRVIGMEIFGLGLYRDLFTIENGKE